MSRWWRAYDEAVDDPKLQSLSDESFRFWFNLCCVCSEFGGNLPTAKHLAFKCRMQERKAQRLLNELKQAGLIDEDDHGVRPHNWNGRQYKSDVSTERVKRHRKRKRNVSEDVAETPPETETETETETEKNTADAVPPSNSPYHFESGVIRLKKEDFDKWEAAFTHLDLRAELIGLTPWAALQESWFWAVSGALAKRNREMAVRKAQATKTSEFKWNGIEGVI